MIFTHDTEVALANAVALVNSDPARSGGVEHLPDVAALDAHFTAWGWTGRHDGTERELAEVRALRPRFAELWELAEDDVAERVNALLSEAQAVPQLVRHDGWDWHLHATTPAAPLATRMAVELGMALVDLVRAGELSRLQVCAADDCRAVLVDLSKNRSRRYCDGGCGNRVNVQAYRARQARHD